MTKEEIFSEIEKIKGCRRIPLEDSEFLYFCTGLCIHIGEDYASSIGWAQHLSHEEALEIAKNEQARMRRRLKAFKEIRDTENPADAFEFYCKPSSDCKITLDAEYLDSQLFAFETVFGEI